MAVRMDCGARSGFLGASKLGAKLPGTQGNPGAEDTVSPLILKEGLRCSLCGKTVRSVYSLPGDKSVRMCSTCFFEPLPLAPAPKTGGGE